MTVEHPDQACEPGADPLADVIRKAMGSHMCAECASNNVAAVRAHIASRLDAEAREWRAQFYDDPEALHLLDTFDASTRMALLGTSA